MHSFARSKITQLFLVVFVVDDIAFGTGPEQIKNIINLVKLNFLSKPGLKI